MSSIMLHLLHINSRQCACEAFDIENLLIELAEKFATVEASRGCQVNLLINSENFVKNYKIIKYLDLK